MSFGSKVRELRQQKNVSQNELAEAMGYKSFTTIQKWESEESEPAFSKMKQIAEFFGVTVEYLTDDDDIKKESAFSPQIQRTINAMRRMTTAGQQVVVTTAEAVLASELKSNVTPMPVREQPLPYVASSMPSDDHSNDEELAEFVRKLKEDEIERS